MAGHWGCKSKEKHAEARRAPLPGVLRHDLAEVGHSALVLLAAGAFTPSAVAQGFARVQELEAEMEGGRRRRLRRLGFAADESATLAALHTRNFM